MWWLGWWMLMVISCGRMVLIRLGTILIYRVCHTCLRLGGDQRATNAIYPWMNFDPWLIQFWDVISFPALLCIIHTCSLNCSFIMTDTVSIGSFAKSLFAFNLYIYSIWMYNPFVLQSISAKNGLTVNYMMIFQVHPWLIDIRNCN
jgi:hypothetical protein